MNQRSKLAAVAAGGAAAADGEVRERAVRRRRATRWRGRTGGQKAGFLETMRADPNLKKFLRCKLEARDVLTSSAATRDYLRLRYQSCEREVFSCLFLNNQHHVVKVEELFLGTIDGAAVYPREVVKRCLQHNAAAVIFAHNHPSGVAEPSQADIAITGKLRTALHTIEVRVLDHLVIGSDTVVSMARKPKSRLFELQAPQGFPVTEIEVPLSQGRVGADFAAGDAGALLDLKFIGQCGGADQLSTFSEH